MTIAQIDDTDLELLLDIELLDSKIDAASAQKGKRNVQEGFVDRFL